MIYEVQRRYLSKTGRRFSMVLCALVALLVTGCMSARVTTNLKPASDPQLKSAAGRFYIASLKFADTNPQAQQNSGADFERNLLPLVRKECATRYPGLFSEQISGCIPLGVQVDHATAMHVGKTLAWELGTVCLCGLIFPCPGDSDEDLAVKAGVWNGRDFNRGAVVETSFRRENHTWVSLLTPSALIHIPGESDFPKISGTLFGIQSQMQEYYLQIAQQTATALAPLVAAKDPEYWAFPAGAETSPSSFQPPPSAVPLPAEPAAPF